MQWIRENGCIKSNCMIFQKQKNKEIKNTAFALKAANYFIQQSVQHMLSDFWKKYLGWVQPCGELGMKASGQQPFRKILWSKYIKKHFLSSFVTCFIWTLLMSIVPRLATASFYRRFLTWELLFHLFELSRNSGLFPFQTML